MSFDTQSLPPANPQVLRAFSLALGREAHVLAREPGLFWQQMYNRLQWEEVNEVLELQCTQRSCQGASPWIRTRTKLRESKAIIYTLLGHQGFVNACEFSPDNSLIISASSDHTVKIWDAKTGQELRSLVGHTGPVNDCSFSPNGQMVITASEDKTLRLWNTATGTQLRSFIGHKDPVNSCVFAPDGRHILSTSGKWYEGNKDNSIRLWDVATGEEVQTFIGHDGQVNACSLSPDMRLLVSCSGEYSEYGTVKIWNTKNQSEKKSLGKRNIFLDCSFSPDGKKIVYAHGLPYGGPALTIINASTGRKIRTLEGHGILDHYMPASSVNGCTFSPDGRFIASASDDMTIKLWGAKTGNVLSTFRGHNSEVTDCAFSRDGRHLLSASKDQSLILWKIGGEPDTYQGQEHWRSVNCCAFSPDGQIVASGSGDQTIKLWGAGDGSGKTTLQHASRGHVITCAFSPDGRLLTAGKENGVDLWDMERWETIGHLDGIYCASAISPNGRMLAWADFKQEKGSRIYFCEMTQSQDLSKTAGLSQDPLRSERRDVSRQYPARQKSPRRHMVLEEKNTCRSATGHSAGVSACTFSPDGRFLASSSYDGTIKLWDTVTAIELYSLSGHKGQVTCCSFSPDGHFLVSSGWDRTIKLWNMEDKIETRTLSGHDVKVTACTFTPDGNMIISVGLDRMLKVWDANTGMEYHTLQLAGPLNCIATHPSLPYLACADTSGRLYFLDMIGFKYGPIILTASEQRSELTIICPSCQTHHPITQAQLGTEITCPTPGCGLRLKINPFVIQMT